jgi:hypothetical protein
MEKEYYYKIYLEVVLKEADFVFGYINISNIPYSKFYELFRDQVTEERFLFDDSIGYFIEKELYLQHKEYLGENIPFTFDFDLFVYSVGLRGVDQQKYKKDYYEELPPLFE